MLFRGTGKLIFVVRGQRRSSHYAVAHVHNKIVHVFRKGNTYCGNSVFNTGGVGGGLLLKEMSPI